MKDLWNKSVFSQNVLLWRNHLWLEPDCSFAGDTMVTIPEYYAGKNVLLSGATGFMGKVNAREWNVGAELKHASVWMMAAALLCNEGVAGEAAEVLPGSGSRLCAGPVKGGPEPAGPRGRHDQLQGEAASRDGGNVRRVNCTVWACTQHRVGLRWSKYPCNCS